MSDRWLLALGLVLACGGALWGLRHLSPFALPVLAVGMTILMGAFYPIASVFVAPRSWRNHGNLSEEAILSTQANYLAFAVGLMLAVGLVAAFKPHALVTPRSETQASRAIVFRDTWVSWGLLAFGAALYLEYIRRIGLATLLSTHDFAEKYLASRGLGTFLIGLNVMIVACLWAEAGRVRRGTLWCMRAVALGIVVWATFFIAVRTYAAAVALGYLAVYCRERRIQVCQIRLRVVLLLLVAYLGLEGYAILRSSWKATGSLGAALEMSQKLDTDEALGGVVGGSELSHPFLTMAEVAQYEEAGTLMGESYVDAVLSFVPSFLWPERPTTLAQEYVAEYYPAVDARGGGSAFSFVAEAWWNFGNLFGPGLAGLALGLFLVACHARSLRWPQGWTGRLLPYMAFVTLIFHRSQLSASFKQAVSVLLPAIGLAIAAEFVFSVFVERRLPTPTRANGPGPRASEPRIGTENG